jgi:mono/diheme cytochrome c family protein
MEPPEGAIPIDGEPPLEREEADRRLRNPVADDAETRKRGRELFDTQCLPCHGREGRGDGPVAPKLGVFMPPLAPLLARRQEGYIYGTIRDGGFSMPRYAEVMSREERWMVARHTKQMAGR